MDINILFYPIISHSLVLSQSKDVAVIDQDKVFELDKSKASLVNVTYHQSWGRETRISYMGD